MSTTSSTATTTYPFTLTTITSSHPPTKFPTPTLIPSIFSFAPGLSCSANSIPTPLPTSYPKNGPSGTKAACAISNDAQVNDHAFWDLYACCKSTDLTAFGSPNLCTAQCVVGEGQTWQELGECLSKRVEVVVCKPAVEEIGMNGTGGSGGGSASSSAASSGAGTAVGVVHGGGSKAGVMLFAVLAVCSFAGMML